MIAQLRGKIIETNLDKEFMRIVLDVQGVGYDVLMAKSSGGSLSEGQAATLYISESVTAFDGATTLYGFSKKEEKEIFLKIRENVDGMGPKKALECLDKISKSLPDFKRAVLEGDNQLLVTVFGFTKKTAEKLVFALKGEAHLWPVLGAPRWTESSVGSDEFAALSGLINLGYREDEAKEALLKAKAQLGGVKKPEQMISAALRLIGAQL